MNWLIMKNYIAYRDQVNNETKNDIQTNVMSSPLPWSSFFKKTVSGKKLETARRKRTEYIYHSRTANDSKAAFSSITISPANTHKYLVEFTPYHIRSPLPAYASKIGRPLRYTSKIKATLLSSVVSLSSHSRGSATDSEPFWAIDEAEIVPMYACVGGL